MTSILELDSFESKQNSINQAFEEYLDGKSVAIVGRAKLDNLEQGSHIDSHDVVVRVHRVVPYRQAYYDGEKAKRENDEHNIDYEWLKRYDIFKHSFVPEDWHSRIGRRTNVYYNRLRVQDERKMKEYLRKFEADGGKFICFNMSGKAHHDYCLMDRLADVRYLNIGFYLQIAGRIGDYPLAGTVAVADTLRHRVTEAYITGFPCYFDNDIDSVTYRSCKKDLQFLSDMRETGRVTFDTHMEELFAKYL